MPEILQYAFMRHAFFVGLLIGILCPLIGTFLVLRRFSMIGDTLAHVSLVGVLLGILWGISPLPLAFFLALLITLALEKLRHTFRDYAELSLAIIMSIGLGLTAILISLTKTTDISINNLLFGSIITLSNQDIRTTVGLALPALILFALFFRQFFFLTVDEEAAQLAGINTKYYNFLLLFLTAMIVILGLRIVGALLVSSLMVIPVATSLLWQQGFRKTLLWSVVFGILSVLIGLTGSFYLDLAPGGTIILTATFIFLLSLPLRKLKQ